MDAKIQNLLFEIDSYSFIDIFEIVRKQLLAKCKSLQYKLYTINEELCMEYSMNITVQKDLLGILIKYNDIFIQQKIDPLVYTHELFNNCYIAMHEYIEGVINDAELLQKMASHWDAIKYNLIHLDIAIYQRFS